MKKIILPFLLALGCAVTSHAQIITTISGNGVHSTGTGDGGPATAAVAVPQRIALDSRGNIYLVDYNYVRIVNRKGIINQFSGGTGATGCDGGPATAAMLSKPNGLFADANGNIYISENGDTIRVRKVDKKGIIHTYAGGGSVYPGDGGPATSAQLVGGLNHMIADAAGNIYIADGFEIHKVDAAGIITKIGGTGVTGWYSGDGIPATDASFFPGQMVMDATDNLYFVDGKNFMVRKINKAGIISTIAGDGWPVGSFSGDGGPSTAARLSEPSGLAIDTAGNLYVADGDNERIRKIDAKTGIINTIIGNGVGAYSGDGGPASAAQINQVADITIDCGGNMYICDYFNSRLRKVTYTAYIDFVSEGNALAVCENSGATSVDNLLQVSDTAKGQAVDWMVYASAMHGTVSGSYSTMSTGGTLTPTGFTYTPASGYSSTDSFTILVGPCAQVGDLRTIYVTANPLPTVAAISGLNSICLGSIVSLSDATTGGTWSVTGAAVTVSAGTVTGIIPGTATISYTVTDKGCSNAVTYSMKVNNCPAGITSPSPSDWPGVRIYPNPLQNTIHIDGVQNETSYMLINILGSTLLTGTLHSGANRISVSNIASGVYMLEVTSSTGMKTTSRIVKE